MRPLIHDAVVKGAVLTRMNESGAASQPKYR
jgi:hypothetical protein